MLVEVEVFFHTIVQSFYRPQTKFAKVMFLHLSVSHSVHRGVSASVQAGIHPPQSRHPQEQTPPGAYTPPSRNLHLRSACWEIRTTSGQYASYWNAYLFHLISLQSIELHNDNLPHFRNWLQVYEIRNVYLYFPGTFTELNTTQLHHMCTSAKKIPSNIAICGMPLWLTQGLFTRYVFQPMSVITTVIKSVLFIVIRTTKRKCVYHPFFPLLMPSLLAQCLTLTVVIKDTGSKTLRVSRPSILTEPRRLPLSRNIQTNRQTNVTSIRRWVG